MGDIINSLLAKQGLDIDVPQVANTVANIGAPGEFDFSLRETILKLDNVNVSYGDKVVLRDVNLDLRNIVRPGHTQGQVAAFLAPSGMGKTQLFRCIAGVQQPTSGAVYLNTSGADVTVFNQVQVGQVGVVAQDYPLFDHLLVIDNLMLVASRRHKENPHDVCMDYLVRFGLEDRAKVYPHQLSGGQRQRIAIIQQIISCGHMLLMDEPFSGLDILVKERVEQLISWLAAQDELNTVFLTTHDIPAAISVADTILLMGHERDPETKQILPGARIVETYDLATMGLTWRENITALPQFNELNKMIAARFHEL
jgi:polar amino acid transport system ATP-binding protein/sulfate transport system ATP-binding protein